jgi:DNA-binding SARP family transcriptional activator
MSGNTAPDGGTAVDAGLVIHLLGSPRLEVDGAPGYRFRSRKSWATLAFLLLGERPPTRRQLASLLFAETDDPLRSLRWSLAELRRGMPSSTRLDGDPLTLALPPGTRVDAHVVVRGHWTDAVRLPGLGSELLEGVTLQGAAPFDSWLLSQRRRLASATEAILHEAALGLLARGDVEAARAHAVRAAMLSPLDENHQALLIRIYRRAGDDAAAERQFTAWCATADRELGTVPGAAVRRAMAERRRPRRRIDLASLRAITEAGAAAVSAGAVEPGIASLQTAVGLADDSAAESLRIETRLAQAEALIHNLGGLDEEGLTVLTEAERIAASVGDRDAVARARVEMGYVDFLRARYERAERSFTQVLAERASTPSTRAKALTYLGCLASDRAHYPRAIAALDEAARLSRSIGEPRREAYSLSMLGRASCLRGQLAQALEQLHAAVELAEGDHWLSFLPWPQAWLGQVLLARGEDSGAEACLTQAFARACELGDPCWEGISARGLALLAESRGDPEEAFTLILDALARSHRLADPYVWLEVHILDALCELGRRHGDPRTQAWVEQMRERAARTDMRELTVRALLHAAAMGEAGARELAVVLAADIDNPRLAGDLSA